MNDQELAEYLALEVGKVLVELRNELSKKLSPRELGDAGDKAGHDLAIRELSKFRPLDHVLSEEGEDNEGRLSANRVWIIDPLDGTSHYSNNEADYAVHVALWERGSDQPFQLIASAIGVPAYKKVIGQTNAKAHPDKSGPIRILVSATRPPEELSQIISGLKEKFPELGEPKLIAMGSVGAKLAQIISGNADLYINTGGFFEWDIAAPAAVAVAHGLTACDIDGKSFTFNQQDTYVPSAIIGRPEFVSAAIRSLA